MDKQNLLGYLTLFPVIYLNLVAVVLGGGEEPDPGGTGSSASVCHWKVCLLDPLWFFIQKSVWTSDVVKSPSLSAPGFLMVALRT